MQFEKMTLPDFLLADLYKEGLVVIDKDIEQINQRHSKPVAEAPADSSADLTGVSPHPEEITFPAPGDTLAFLGNNRKNVAIVVNDEKAIHLQDDLLEMLSNILAACKLNLADVAIINCRHQPVDDARLKKELSPQLVLLFGVETQAIELPFSIPEYRVQPFGNCRYLQAPSLEQMRGNSTAAKLEKSKLWVSLKSIFGV